MLMNLTRAFGVLVCLPIILGASIVVAAESDGTSVIVYDVPPQFTSTKQQLASDQLAKEEREKLELRMQTLEEVLGAALEDLLVSKAESESFSAIAIGVEVTDPEGVSVRKYFDNAFEWMETMASHIPNAAEQTRQIHAPSGANGFHRMDVQNAYGTLGDFASFLLREESGYDLVVIIISSIDPYAVQFESVVNSIKLVAR